MTSTQQNFTPLELKVIEQTNSQIRGLSSNERDLLKFLFGYTKGSNGRKRLKRKADASDFIKNTIFQYRGQKKTKKDRKSSENNDDKDDDNDDDDDDEIFQFEGSDKRIDLKNVNLFPTITNSDPQAMEDFLSHGGVSFSSAEEEKIVRTLTDFNRVYATDLHINRFSDKGLTGYIAGKASRKN